jgi:hypothetical protein
MVLGARPFLAVNVLHLLQQCRTYSTHPATVRGIAVRRQLLDHSKQRDFGVCRRSKGRSRIQKLFGELRPVERD